jgi:hypothetical protein
MARDGSNEEHQATNTISTKELMLQGELRPRVASKCPKYHLATSHEYACYFLLALTVMRLNMSTRWIS